MNFTSGQIVEYVQTLLWPFLRIMGLFLTAPFFSAALVPARVKAILALALALVVAPLVGKTAPVEPFGLRLMLMAANQILIGMAIGFVVQLVFEALTFAGQTIAMSMGLGYATLVDPQRGATVPVVSQFMLILGLLLFLSLDGHIAVLQLLADSFHWMPVGGQPLSAQAGLEIARWGGKLFEAGVMVALPALVALIVINLALGIVSRAAPSLNLFAVGFPLSLGLGFLVLLVSLYNLQEHFVDLLGESFRAVRAMLGSTE